MSTDRIDPAAAFAELGRIKLSDNNLEAVLTRIADLAQQTLPGADEVSVTLVRQRRPRTAASTGPLALTLDLWQYERGAGPCMDAAAAKATLYIADMSGEQRWPDWTAVAVTAGAASSLSVGLPIEDELTGALNIYARLPHAFGAEATRLAQMFAGYATVAMANAHLYDTTAHLAKHMQKAMETRAVIEQAKGIIMGERRCTADEAFRILSRTSQDANRRLYDVAAALVARAQTVRHP